MTYLKYKWSSFIKAKQPLKHSNPFGGGVSTSCNPFRDDIKQPIKNVTRSWMFKLDLSVCLHWTYRKMTMFYMFHEKFKKRLFHTSLLGLVILNNQKINKKIQALPFSKHNPTGEERVTWEPIYEKATHQNRQPTTNNQQPTTNNQQQTTNPPLRWIDKKSSCQKICPERPERLLI